jgi:peptidoglycan/LPS O-acetylase OafA/YrhL
MVHQSKHNLLILRGMSILSVVTIHYLSSLPPETYTTSSWQPFNVALDQLLRFSVPLFVMLSGYALSRKYQETPFTWKEFLWKRVMRLLPLFFFWSLLSYIFFSFLPLWHTTIKTIPIWHFIFLGSADYHLYFVSMIFQLYLLFPLLRGTMQKISPLLILGITLGIQLAFFLYYVQLREQQATLFHTDQARYLFAGSWIGYFTLGIWLGKLKPLTFPTQKIFLVTAGGALMTWAWISYTALFNIRHGLDPLEALSFTRWPILIYASLANVALYLGLKKANAVPAVIRQPLRFIGQHSYLIYLCHTIFLRIIFTTHNHTWPHSYDILWVVPLFILGILCSLQIEKF